MKKKRLKTSETQILHSEAVSSPSGITLETSKLASNEAFFSFKKIPVPRNVPNNSSYRKRFLRVFLPYKLPTIVRAKAEWFVKYFYEIPNQPGKYKEFRVRDGVNMIKDPEQKEKEIQQLCKDVKYALQVENYNPFAQKEYVKKQIRVANNAIEQREKLMTLDAGIDWVIETKEKLKRSNDGMYEYVWIKRYFIPWCYKQGKHRINDPTIDDIELFLSEMLESEQWSARTYNNKVAILTSFFNYLLAKRKMPVNPIGPGMLERIKNTAEKNKYYDQETLDIILPEVSKKEQLRRFIRYTYYTCARGTELRALKIKNVDLNIKKVVITAESGKTGEHVGKRNIPICNELYEMMVEENLKDLPGEWYVFGAKGQPGPKPCGEGYFSDMYNKIKKKLKIDFKYTIYSFKHTRIVDLLVAGFDPIKVMYITGHTDWGSFEKYIRELGAVMDKQLIGNTLKLNL